MIDLSYIKLYERCVQLWIIYRFTLLKQSTFYGNIIDRNMFSYQFKKDWPNFDIIVIIMW
jgi:hypothetical protein